MVQNSIWSLKPLVGSNQNVSDLDADIRHHNLCPNICLNGEKRAFGIFLNKSKSESFDIEFLLSFVIEYAIYLNMKCPGDTYDAISSIIQKSKNYRLALSVFDLFRFTVDSKLCFSVVCSRTPNVFRLQRSRNRCVCS